MIPTDAPQWLKDAETTDAKVEISGDVVIWRGGVWHGGVWGGGDWWGGEWRGGDWHGGDWYGGVWRGGDWRGGEWHGVEDRLLLHAAQIGIVFDADGMATAYRTTDSQARGRHNTTFVQQDGRVDVKHEPRGSGTCVAGLHATSAARAWTYFGVDPTCLMWRVRFHRDDLLDCDGEKVRLRGGWCERIAVPFLRRVPVAASVEQERVQ